MRDTACYRSLPLRQGVGGGEGMFRGRSGRNPVITGEGGEGEILPSFPTLPTENIVHVFTLTFSNDSLQRDSLACLHRDFQPFELTLQSCLLILDIRDKTI